MQGAVARARAGCGSHAVADAGVAGCETGMKTGLISAVPPTMVNNARERAADHRFLLRLNALGFFTHGRAERRATCDWMNRGQPEAPRQTCPFSPLSLTTFATAARLPEELGGDLDQTGRPRRVQKRC